VLIRVRNIYTNMKQLFIVCLFLISLNTFGQTGSGMIEQTFIFQLADESGQELTKKSIAKKEISIMNSDINNLIFNGLEANGEYVIVREGIRYYGDYVNIQSTDLQLVYELGGAIMTIDIKNIQAAYLKITKIPFKSGNYTIDLQRESDFIKKMIIEPTEWEGEKVVFEATKKQ
jgi:hypothetical protein